MKVAKINI